MDLHDWQWTPFPAPGVACAWKCSKCGWIVDDDIRPANDMTISGSTKSLHCLELILAKVHEEWPYDTSHLPPLNMSDMKTYLP